MYPFDKYVGVFLNHRKYGPRKTTFQKVNQTTYKAMNQGFKTKIDKINNPRFNNYIKVSDMQQDYLRVKTKDKLLLQDLDGCLAQYNINFKAVGESFCGQIWIFFSEKCQNIMTYFFIRVANLQEFDI